MADETKRPKSSLRNNIAIAFFLVIVIWGIAITRIFQDVLYTTLVQEGLDKVIIENIARNFTTLSTGVTIVGLVIVLFIAVLLSKTITTPIKKLTETVVEVARGKLDVKVDIVSEDEFGQLADSFNKMAKDLSKSRDELITAKDYTDNIIKSMIDTMLVVDPDGRIKTINPAITKLLGYKEDELIGKPVATIFVEEAVAEEKLEKILNEIDDAAVLISKDFKIFKANDTFIEIIGLEKKDIIGQFCYKVTHHRNSMCEAPDARCPIHEVVKKHKSCVELHTHFDKEGNRILVAVAAAPIMDDSGDLLYYLHLAKTDREGGKEKDRTQKESLDIATKIIDKLRKYVEKLERTRIFTGSGLNRLIKMGAVKDIEMYYKTKTGEKILVSFSGAVMRDKEEKLAGIVGIAKDMREIKRLMQKEKELAAQAAVAEAERKKVVKLNKAYKELKEMQEKLIRSEKLAALGRLAGSAAHELRNPLGVMKNSIYFLKMKLSQAIVDEKIIEYLVS